MSAGDHDDRITDLRGSFDLLLAHRDRAGAVTAALEAVHSGHITIDDLYSRVLVPLLVDTGAGWQQGTTPVWEEHFASTTVRGIVEALTPDVAIEAAAAPARSETVLLACPPGEQHDLGLRILSDRLALRGWNAVFLGADTPADQIIQAARTIGASLVLLSAATHLNRSLLHETIARLEVELPGVRIGVGGPAFAQNHDWPAGQLLDEADLGLDTPPPAEVAS